MNRYREMLYTRPDRHDDDCEGCHQFAGQLWEDTFSPGEYMLCADCVRRAARKEEQAKAGVKVTQVMLANGPATIVCHPRAKVPGTPI